MRRKTPLFRGHTLSDGHELSEQAMELITEKCEKDGIVSPNCCLSEEPFHPWYDRSLLTILKKYHAEVDEMFCGLLEWSVGSLQGQAKAFSARDKQGGHVGR